MSWQDLLAKPDDTVTVPWTGGRDLLASGRRWAIAGRLPLEHGWHKFSISGGRKAKWQGVVEVDPATFFAGSRLTTGYLVGDRILPDRAVYIPDPAQILPQSEQVFLVDPGLDRFTRASVGRHEGSLVFVRQEFPLGPEGAVQEAFQDRKISIAEIAGVTPALDLAFRFECWQRELLAERRRLLDEQRRQEDAARALEERKQNLVRQLGDGAGRRAMALVDFETAARAALAVGGAELLDWRESHTRGEKVVQFRFRNRRFECVCDSTMHIVDSGVCLQGGDRLFTLESLPGVLGMAMDRGVLHVFRHVDPENEPRWDRDEDTQDED